MSVQLNYVTGSLIFIIGISLGVLLAPLIFPIALQPTSERIRFAIDLPRLDDDHDTRSAYVRATQIVGVDNTQAPSTNESGVQSFESFFQTTTTNFGTLPILNVLGNETDSSLRDAKNVGENCLAERVRKMFTSADEVLSQCCILHSD